MTAPSSTLRAANKRGCAMAMVVVGDAFDVAEPHGKHGLGAFEGLDLALLIDAKHHCLVGRIEIKPDHVAQLLDEKGIGRKLEAAGAVRLNVGDFAAAIFETIERHGERHAQRIYLPRGGAGKAELG